jgi:hypothetical protein
VMKYVHVRQESRDGELELFEAKNNSEPKRWSRIEGLNRIVGSAGRDYIVRLSSTDPSKRQAEEA